VLRLKGGSYRIARENDRIARRKRPHRARERPAR